MKHVALYYDTKSPRGRSVVTALQGGIAQKGDKVKLYEATAFTGTIPPCDVVCWYGLSGPLMELGQQLWETQHPSVFFDLPYWGRKHEPHPQHHRFSINAHQPTAYFRQNRPHDRFLAFERLVHPWREDPPREILVAGMSEKQTQAWGLGPSWEFHVKLIQAMRDQFYGEERPIAWRPKPACKISARPIPGTRYANGSLADELQRVGSVYTYRSNTAVDGLMAGISCVVLSDHPARVFNWIYGMSQKTRLQFCADLAYCQTSMQELRNGWAWKFICEQLDDLCM